MHLHPPHQLSVPFVLLSVVYASAIAVALAHPGRPTVAGLFVLVGLTARWAARHRRRSPARAVAVLNTNAAPARATAA